jgi:hypothetical protein
VCKVLPDRPRPCYHHWELMTLNTTHLWTKWKPEATRQRYSGVACQIIVVFCKCIPHRHQRQLQQAHFCKPLPWGPWVPLRFHRHWCHDA